LSGANNTPNNAPAAIPAKTLNTTLPVSIICVFKLFFCFYLFYSFYFLISCGIISIITVRL
jgi:hypothetical protein